jgi:hypothetical protein
MITHLEARLAAHLRPQRGVLHQLPHIRRRRLIVPWLVQEACMQKGLEMLVVARKTYAVSGQPIQGREHPTSAAGALHAAQREPVCRGPDDAIAQPIHHLDQQLNRGCMQPGIQPRQAESAAIGAHRPRRQCCAGCLPGRRPRLPPPAARWTCPVASPQCRL